MLDPTLLILASGGLTLGIGAAQIGGPISWNWRPRRGAIQKPAEPGADRGGYAALFRAVGERVGHSHQYSAAAPAHCLGAVPVMTLVRTIEVDDA